MRITWYGHAAFLVEGATASGEPRRVILDPYNFPECGGYLPIDEPADVVSVSHENRRYHSDTSAIRGDFELVEALAVANAAGRREARGVVIEACEVFENESREGPNAMVKFELDGVTVAHQGDLGHPLEGDALEFLRGVDVLLALAGGAPTIDLADLVEIVDAIRPAVVIPMHFKTPKVNLNILTLDHFLRLCEGYRVERPGTTNVDLTAGALPEPTTIVVLEHAR